MTEPPRKSEAAPPDAQAGGAVTPAEELARQAPPGALTGAEKAKLAEEASRVEDA
ncbi:MAG TPA: hypothetical protein VMU93_00265 [Caulobacteraceae bacterium]|nr:hypothetical protein [Caulobacteraceae bacterium]